MVLPSFLVVGAAKAGTTSLHHYLRSHPEVHLPAVKETNFFWSGAAAAGRRTPATPQAYEELFAGGAAARAIGEVSPRYLNDTTAATRISALLPDVRIVVALREPAARAYSDYLGRVRILRESRSFEEAVRPGEECREWGFYRPRLQRYYDTFARENIHVLLHEDLLLDTDQTLRALFAFLGVGADVQVDTSRHHNSAGVARSALMNRVLWPAAVGLAHFVPVARRGSGRAEQLLRRTYRQAPAPDPRVMAELRAAYADDVIGTQRLIGRDLSAWLGEPTTYGLPVA